MGSKRTTLPFLRGPLARVVLVLIVFGAAVLLLELFALQCRGSNGAHCSLFWNAVSSVDELGLQSHEFAAELAAEDATVDDVTTTAWLHAIHRDGNAERSVRKHAGDGDGIRTTSNSNNSNVRDVPPGDLLHLSLLQAACLKHKESVIPWRFGKPGAQQDDAKVNMALLLDRDDPRLVPYLQQCPDVDVYIPGSLRGHGYCEDAAAYGKYLKTRLLPRWVFDTPLIVDTKRNRTVMYHELCPHTPVILFNHYWDGLPDAPTWPATKRVYLMPNIEMFELNEQFYWRADVVLCKTRDCVQRLTKWYAQEGNPRGTKVLYTRHTTSDVAHFAHHALGDAAIKRKDFANITSFIHTAGSSGWKGTRQVLDCWLSRPDLPRLELYISDAIYTNRLAPDFDDRVRASPHIQLSMAQQAPLAFGKMIAEASVFLCPSVMEGYGHYINQARASGGVIVTTDVAPMNELVTADAGVLVRAAPYQNPRMFLAGAFTRAPHGLRDVDGMSAHFTGADVCRAVDFVLHELSTRDREALAARTQQQYHVDTAFFARQMRVLRRFARKQARTQTDLERSSNDGALAQLRRVAARQHVSES